MSGWIKIPDNWVENDLTEDLGAEAVMLHLSALSLCSRQGSDGDLPTRALRRLWPCDDLDTAVKKLETANEWRPTEDGWHLPNWNVHLLSADEVERRRELSRTTSERYRRHRAGDHSMCDRCAAVKAGDASRDKSLPTSVTTLDSQRLDSPRSDSGEERGEETNAGARSAGATRAPRPEDEIPNIPFRCPHGRVRGLHYDANDGRMQCPDCAAVAPVRDEAHAWVEQSREQGLTSADIEVMEETISIEEYGLIAQVASAVYAQVDGRWTAEDLDPVDPDLLHYLEGYALIALHESKREVSAR